MTATSASNGNITFKAVPPNPDIVMSRLVYLTMQAKIRIHGRANTTVAGGGGGANVIGAEINYDLGPEFCGVPRPIGGAEDDFSSRNNICLRQFPLASIMRTLKMTMNSTTETVEPYKYIHALGRYNLDDDQRAYEMSSTPVPQLLRK